MFTTEYNFFFHAGSLCMPTFEMCTLLEIELGIVGFTDVPGAVALVLEGHVPLDQGVSSVRT